jgi:hypothetical protein
MRTYPEEVMFALIGYAYEVTSIPPEVIASTKFANHAADVRVIITDIAFMNYTLSKADIARSLNVSERVVLDYIERYALVMRENKEYSFIRRMIYQHTDDHMSTKRKAYFCAE